MTKKHKISVGFGKSGIWMWPEEFLKYFEGIAVKLVDGVQSSFLDASRSDYKQRLAQIRKALKNLDNKDELTSLREENETLRSMALFYQRLYREKDPQKAKQILEDLQNFIVENKDILGNAQVLPEIEDPTDKRLWEYIKDDPTIDDIALAQKMGNLDRQNVNRRRKTLEKMGYQVRKPKVSRQKP
jgi:hypothetical protein